MTSFSGKRENALFFNVKRESHKFFPVIRDSDPPFTTLLVVARKTPDFNRIIGDFAILLTFYSVGLLSQHAGFMLRLQFILYWFL